MRAALNRPEESEEDMQGRIPPIRLHAASTGLTTDSPIPRRTAASVTHSAEKM